jgi:hypothetical protein
MLLLGSDIEVSGLIVFRDHIAPRTFHYLPGAPRVVTDAASGGAARPGLQLLRYRGARDGGLLALDVDLAVPDATLAAARAALAAKIGGDAPVDLVPVLFTEGTVRLTALGVDEAPPIPSPADSTAPSGTAPAPAPGTAGPVLVERIVGTAVPSLLGHGRAIFSLELDREGTSLLDAAIRSAGTPLAVVYDLAYAGLRPARGLIARVRYQMAYDYLRTRAALSSLWFKADLDRETEALAKAGHITIEDVDYQGLDPAILAQRAEEVRKTLGELSESLFFRPATSPRAVGDQAAPRQPGVDAAWAARGRPQAAFVLRELAQREEQELTYDLREAAVATARVAPQGALAAPPGVDPASLVRDVTLDAPPVALEVRAFALPGADWTGVGAVTVDLRGGVGGREVRTLVLTPAASDQSALLPAEPRDAVEQRIRVLATLEPEALGAPPPADPPFAPLAASTLALDPAALAGRRVVRIALGVIDAEMVRQVRGRLKSGGQAHEFLLSLDGAGSGHAEDAVPVWGSGALQVEAELALVDGGAVAVAQDVAPGQPAVAINQPADRFQTVWMALQDPLDRYASLLVEIEGAAGERHRSFSLDAATPSARWSAPRAAGAPRAFRYKVRKVGRDAAVSEEDWQDGAGSLLPVGDLDLRVETIDVVLVGGGDAAGALVRLTSLAPPAGIEAAVETLTEPGQTEIQVRLPFRQDAPRSYRVEGQVFLDQGERAIAPREETAEVLILMLGG